jgi:hypothetical protein
MREKKQKGSKREKETQRNQRIERSKLRDREINNFVKKNVKGIIKNRKKNETFSQKISMQTRI